MSVSKRDRFEVFKRDRFTCQYCGRKPPDVVLNCDHILAVSLGGGDGKENLITSCFDCNSGKSDKPLERISAPISFNIEEQAEKLEQIRAYADQSAKEAEYWAECEEIVIERWCTLEGQPAEAGKWLVSTQLEMAVKQFVKRLTVQEILNATDIAWTKFGQYHSERSRFKYFCGCCWKTIRDRNPQQKETIP